MDSDTDIHTHTFQNGLTLALEPMPWLPSASFELLLPFGAATDPEGAYGSATALHDWLYRGAGERDSRAFSEALDALGVRRSGGAGGEGSTFSGSLLADALPEALALYADLVRRPHLTDGEFEGARTVALQELASLDDSPTQRLFIALSKAVFASSHGRSAYGAEADLKALTPEGVRADFARLAPQGAILSVAGGVGWELFKDTVAALFGDWQGAGTPLPEVALKKPHHAHVTAQTSQTQIGVAFEALPPGDPAWYENALAVGVLSGGMGSRLFSEVREKRGLVYSVAAVSRSVRGFGYTLGYAGTTPERADETLRVLLGELVRLREGVLEDELERARTGLLSHLVMQGESSGARAGALARDLFLLGAPRTVAQVQAGVEAVTPEGLNRFLAERPEPRFTVLTLGPKPLAAADKVPSPAEPTPDALEGARMTFLETTLDNGLTVIGEHNPRARSVAAGYFVRTGARDETLAEAGVSHFLEHMMFKGTERRSAEAINLEFDALGANYNAYTSDERTVYYGAVLPTRAGALLDLLTDMMRPALRQGDFDLEKNVILEEIAMYEDRPSFKVFEEGGAHFYRGHPLGNSVLGSVDSIRALTREQMLAYFGARYAADNLFLTLSGDFDWDAVLAQVEDLTKGWGPSGAARRYPALRAAVGDTQLSSPQLARTHTALYAPGVSAQDPLRSAAGVLANLLGDGSGSRLYWALLDNGLAESASLSHDAADGAGVFVGYLSTGPEALSEALRVYRATLLEVQEGGVNAEEWARAQRKLATSLTLRGETPFGRLMSLGVRYGYDGRYASVQETIDKIMAATPDDARTLLSRRPFDALFSLTLAPESV